MTILKRSFGLGVHQRVQHGTNPTIPPQQVVTDAMLTSDEGVSFYFASSDVGEENVYLQLS